ncbi:Ide [Symbiodinium natans]|uniref:Ide protein n=1 Tax=Symbiodinium natans TaxID=878477 RepID=A0A812P1A0_9DINO|nr:Ide [Symbiodinium natans]
MHNPLRSETSTKLKELVEKGLQEHLGSEAARGVESFQTCRQKIAKMVNSNTFEYAAGMVILANMIVIGIEAQESLNLDQLEFAEYTWPWFAERLFLLIYSVEIVLRIIAGGCAALKDPWFLMDFTLVCIGWAALLFLPLAGVDALAAEKLLIVRGLRLLRLVRALRMINHFKVIWRLVYGLLTAGQTIASTTILILVSLFVCSCVAVELIGKDNDLLSDSTTGPIVNMHFRGIDRSLITLMQFVTLDSVASIYFPLIMLKPYLSLFFLGLIVVVSIGLMNLVTAAVLENAMQAAVQDAEAEKNEMMNTVKEAIPELLKIFQSIDKDNSGILTRDEVLSVGVDIIPQKFLQTVHVGSFIELFDYLDVDQTAEHLGSWLYLPAVFASGSLCLKPHSKSMLIPTNFAEDSTQQGFSSTIWEKGHLARTFDMSMSEGLVRVSFDRFCVLSEEMSDERRWGAVSAAVSAAGLAALAEKRRARAARADPALAVVERPPLDNREYKPITLQNGLRVLVCSDRAADRAAAALDVHVGYFNDPPEVQGLAHFCEHMLFLGTEQYPDESSFDAYLTANSGSSNAFTEAEDTCFFFSCSTAGLRSALERFGTFFQNPLFTSSATEREVNAINSEHLKNVPSDVYRMGQVLNSRANPAHPYHQFGTGNIKTLLEDTASRGIDLRAELVRYYRRYYRAPLMTLCILGDEPPDVLARYAEQFFGKVPGLAEGEKLDPAAAYADQPLFLPEAFKQGVEAVPVADARELQVVFPVPFAPGTRIVAAEEAPDSPVRGSMTVDSWRWYSPTSHVGSVLGHEGPRSLCALLRRRGWITALEVGSADDTSTFAVVVVSMELTEEGLTHKDQILELLFGYVNYLRSLSVWPQELLSENLQLSDAGWASREKEGPMDSAVRLVGNMQDWAFPRDYVRGNNRLRNGPGLEGTVDALLQFLRADNAIITVVSRNFEAEGNETEPWYGTRFRRRQLSQQPRWLRVSAAPGLGLPDPNPFLPRSLELKAPRAEPSSKNAVVLPEYKIDKVWEAFFTPDMEYGVPKAYAFIELRTKLPRSSPRAAVCARIYESMFEQALQETLLYDADVAGLAFNFTTSMRGVELFFGGFDDRLADFASAALGALLAFDPTDARGFRAQADLLQRELESFATQAPSSQAAYWTGLATVVDEISFKELEAALAEVTARDVAAFASALWASPVVGISLCEGNLRQSEADSLISNVRKSLKSENFIAVPVSEWPTPRVAKVPANSFGPGVVLVNQIMDPAEENSAVELSFQAGSTRSGSAEDLQYLSELQVLTSVLSDEFYEELRTRQQLGYVVNCRLDRGEGAFRIVFLVQGAVLRPVQVLDRIDMFIEGAMSLIDAKSDKEIAALADALAQARLVRPQQLAEASQRRWGEIRSRAFRWQRRLEEALALKAVKKQDVKEAFRRWLAPGGSERRRLVSFCGPAQALQTLAAELEGKGAQVVTDPQNFARQQPQWPALPVSDKA